MATANDAPFTQEEMEMMDDEELQKPTSRPDSSMVKSRKERPTGSTHVGDEDFFEEDAEDIADATWEEVCRTCCCHTPLEWGMIFVGVVILCFFLYFFLVGLELLGTAAKVLGGCTAGGLLGGTTNPIAGLMIGLLATVLLQSSSTTTSIIVSLVGAGSIQPKLAIYMVMGANIGTSVTNTIVAMGQMGNGDQLERAFAGATVHDMFNFLSVAVLLPIEAATGYLYYLTKAMTNEDSVSDGETWEGPIKALVAPLGNKIIIANKDVITAVAKGGSCADFYPIVCENPSEPTKKTCKGGLIGCDKKTNECPAFFDPYANQHDDKVSGGVSFFLALVILVVCLIGLVTILQKMLLGMSTRIIYKATNINGYLAIAIGCGITVLVQSSSITTSTLTPLVGMGVLHLEQMYPLTLGANIGTTVTALLAAMVSDSVEALQVALAHLFFNVSGILIWYPIPFMRRIPMGAARRLGRATRIWRGFPIVYIAIAFFLLPLVLLGLSSLFEQHTTGFTVLGAFLCIFIGLFIIWFVRWWRCKGGQQACVKCMERRQAKKTTMGTLPEDMQYLKAKVAALSDFTGLPDEEVEEDMEAPEKTVEDDDTGNVDEETSEEDVPVEQNYGRKELVEEEIDA